MQIEVNWPKYLKMLININGTVTFIAYSTNFYQRIAGSSRRIIYPDIELILIIEVILVLNIEC